MNRSEQFMDRRVSPDVQEVGIRYTPNPWFLMGFHQEKNMGGFLAT